MTLRVSRNILTKIQEHGEQAFPEEGAGFLIGVENHDRIVQAISPIANIREAAARHNRYLISPDDYLKAELEADRLGLSLIGVFHSHPDHPSQPSEYDREWAQPNFTYVITRIASGKALESRAWRLVDDRSRFVEEDIENII